MKESDVTDVRAIPSPTDASAAQQPVESNAGYWRNVWSRLRRDKVTMTVTAILLAIVMMAIFAPWVASYDPYAGGVLRRLKPVGTPGHWLGTDETGRDLWSRIAYGGRLSLLSGVLPVAIALMIGGTLGVVAGYAGGRLNTIIMRTMHFPPSCWRSPSAAFSAAASPTRSSHCRSSSFRPWCGFPKA
jgi:peptide/nickel transport system permease protein